MTTRDFPFAAGRELLEVPLNPAPVRQAATVMLLRDGAHGLEVFMLRRVSTMAFAPSMHVFPGGGVDLRDATDDLPWAGPDVDDWARTMDCPPDEVRALVAAAAREVFEETGVLLAGDDEGSDPVERLGGADAAARARQDLVGRELSFAELLGGAGLRLRSDLLGYRAHWITPEIEPRRYDTRFFVAEVPPGQEPDGETTEADRAEWVRPQDVLAAAEAGEARLMPPTIVCLEQLQAAGSVSRALGERPAIAPVMPVLVDTGAGTVMRAELP